MKNFNNNNSCGVVNSRGKPCQRTGFCPFHHKVNRKRQKVENSDEEEEKKEILIGNRKLDRVASMKVSILLIAAAAIEKNALEIDKTNLKPLNLQNPTTTTSVHKMNELSENVSTSNSSGIGQTNQ
jgi:hypothetical protein